MEVLDVKYTILGFCETFELLVASFLAEQVRL
jgi:hypothetical protein